MSDMATHRETGKVEAKKLRKRLKRKTGNKVEILPPKKDDKDGGGIGAGHKAPNDAGGICGEVSSVCLGEWCWLTYLATRTQMMCMIMW